MNDGNIIEYKGYIGSVEFSEEDSLFHGRVLGIRSMITYEGRTTDELAEDFRGAVDDYLIICEAEGIAPERSCAGQLKISPDLHKQLEVNASKKHMSVNSYLREILDAAATV